MVGGGRISQIGNKGGQLGRNKGAPGIIAHAGNGCGGMGCGSHQFKGHLGSKHHRIFMGKLYLLAPIIPVFVEYLPPVRIDPERIDGADTHKVRANVQGIAVLPCCWPTVG